MRCELINHGHRSGSKVTSRFKLHFEHQRPEVSIEIRLLSDIIVVVVGVGVVVGGGVVVVGGGGVRHSVKCHHSLTTKHQSRSEVRSSYKLHYEHPRSEVNIEITLQSDIVIRHI